MIRDIYDYVKRLSIIDTHEHLPFFEKQRQRNDVIAEFLTHYLSSDLVSAGLPGGDLSKARGNGLSVEEKWELIGDYWEACRTMRCIRTCAMRFGNLWHASRISEFAL